jgi:hypothetical protein
MTRRNVQRLIRGAARNGSGAGATVDSARAMSAVVLDVVRDVFGGGA